MNKREEKVLDGFMSEFAALVDGDSPEDPKAFIEQVRDFFLRLEAAMGAAGAGRSLRGRRKKNPNL